MMDKNKLEQRIIQLESEFKGEFSIAVRRLDKAGEFVFRENRVLPTASVYKLFIICELFRQVDAGTLDLNERLAWSDKHYCSGDGVLRAMREPQDLSIYNLAVLMIIVSDNIATRVLLERVGAENVKSSLRRWGFKKSRISADLLELPVSSAGEIRDLVVRIYKHELLSPVSCDEIIRIMRAQRCNDMLPRFIPVGEDWGNATQWIANKTGYGVCRVEAGIVKTDDVTFALAAFFKPDPVPKLKFKCLADYPPVLAMARVCVQIYESLLS